jgi:flagellar hook-associated protein 2
MGTSSSAIFTGSSQFSQDFANSITRAVGLASQPITALKADVTTLQSQHDALSGTATTTGIDQLFAALQTAVKGIGTAMSGSSYQADVSNTAAVDVTLADGAMEGIHSIDVQNIGVYATSQSSSTWVNQPIPSGQTHTYQLVIDTGNGPTTTNITTSDNSATGVAQAINLAAGDKVQASVVYVQGTNDPRISLRSNTLGPATLDLNDGATVLQTQGPQGALASYAVDGNAAVSSTSRTVTIAPGVNVTMKAADSDPLKPAPVDITVTRSTSALIDALTAFTSAYNAAVNSLDAQRGQTQGPLGGQPIVTALSQTLSSVATYALPDSNIGGLKLLGMEVQKNGQMTFNSGELMAANFSNSTSLTAFLGSATGGGFLKAATDAMSSVEGSTDGTTTGFIKTTEADLQSQIDATNTNITEKQAQVDQLQQNLQDQMAAADAAISSMEQQYSYLSSMFQAMQTAAQQYK